MINMPGAAIALFASLGTLATTPPADMVDAPPAAPISLKLLNSTGSGCRTGTVDVAASADNSAIVVRYSAAYEALVGPGAKPTDARKNCQLSVSTTPPAGYTYTIDAIGFSGTAHLQETATATMKSNFYSSGVLEHPRSRTIPGPSPPT